MRIIVNESQYNKILIKEKKNIPTFDSWVNYMGDIVATHIHKFNVKEDVNTHTNLSNILRGKTFFKELPIENFIISLVENVHINDIKISFNPYWSLLQETTDNYILKDIELDIELPSRKINGINEINIIKDQLRKEFIKINIWRNSSTLLSEQVEDDVYIPYTWDPGTLEDPELWDDAAEMNRFFNEIIGKKIHVIGDNEGNITIKDEFDLVEKKALELANTALTTPLYIGFEKDSNGEFIKSTNGIDINADKEKYEEEDRLLAQEKARLRAEEEARVRAEEEAEVRRVYMDDLKSQNIYFINLDDVSGMSQGTNLGEEVIKGEYPIFEKVEDIPDDFHDYFKYALINTRDADLNTLSDEDIMTYHPPEVKVYNVDVWEKNNIQFVQPVEISINHPLFQIPSLGKSDYGMRGKIQSLCDQGKQRYCKRHFHAGEDYSEEIGTYIYLFKPGVVVDKGAYTLKIKHEDGTISRYMHCDEFFVNIGDKVEKGGLIGTVGDEGPSTAPHLHVEYYEGGKVQDPKKFVKEFIRFVDKDKDINELKP